MDIFRDILLLEESTNEQNFIRYLDRTKRKNKCEDFRINKSISFREEFDFLIRTSAKFGDAKLQMVSSKKIRFCSLKWASRMKYLPMDQKRPTDSYIVSQFPFDDNSAADFWDALLSLNICIKFLQSFLPQSKII